ncbi:MAG: DUF1653 domain-containing protein [Acetivibrio sp.]
MEQGRMPVAGDVYRHFKDRLYEVVAIAIHSETEEKMIVYKQLYGDFETYVRPLSMFLSEVDHEKYPEIAQKYRFEWVQKEKSEKEKVNVLLMRFLDAETAEEKIKVLEECSGKLDDHILNNMAISTDIVIPEGNIEDRLMDLRDCLRTKARFEGSRLR